MVKIAAAVILMALSAVSAWAEPVYRLHQGEVWKGVTIGGQPPRTRDVICRDRRCYPVSRQFPLGKDLLKRYGLDRYGYAELARLPEVQSLDDSLILPNDMGRRLYRDAERDAALEQRESRRRRWPR